MIQMEVNNVLVELKPQDRQVFTQLLNSILPAMVGGKKIIELLCSILSEGTKRGIESTNPTYQAALWAMYQIGVRGVRIHNETNNADLKTEKSTEFDNQPFESHFTIGNIATGRAMVASALLFTFDSSEIRCALQVLADISVAAFSYSVENKTFNIEGFNEANACALAYLQGMEAEQISQMHLRAVNSNARMRGTRAQPIITQRRRRS